MFYEIPSALEYEIDELENLILKYRENRLDASVLKAHRVPFGIYEQRKRNSYMIRIRCPGGAFTPRQLKIIAHLSIQYGADSVHITTRQELQLHNIAIDHVIPILRELYRHELATRGGGGNTVRNITASPDSGISKDEVFDVMPYVFALTGKLISESDSWLLPRKFKIAFSSSAKDSANAMLNDLGFIATMKNGLKGFKVYAAGGMGAKSEVGHSLHDFIPDSDLYLVAETVKRFFDKHGNRKNKHAARLRFVWNNLGEQKFLELYLQELENTRKQSPVPLEIRAWLNETPSVKLTPVRLNSPEFYLWKKRYVAEQKQDGLYSVMIPVLLGNLSNNNAVILSDFLIPFGDNTLRATMDQNLMLRNIPEIYLGNVYEIAGKISGFSALPKFYSQCVACTGADTCQLGFCLSKNAVNAVISKLKNSDLDLDMIPDFKLHISGCPNSCGQHLTADLGFYGKVGRKGQRFYPLYAVVAGAVRGDGNSRFAQPAGEISARDLPDFIVKALKQYLVQRLPFTSFAFYADGKGKDELRLLCNQYRDIPDFEKDESYYHDWGDENLFSVAGKGIGECSTGLFDLIDFDLKNIRELRKKAEEVQDENNLETCLYQSVLFSSRMLLVTRGVEAFSDETIFENFRRLFIETKLINSKFLPVIDAAMKKESRQLVTLRNEVLDLGKAVEDLYLSMDNSLRFPKEIEKNADQEKNSPVSGQKNANASGNSENLFRDYRGVACPMNFVKTKLDLSTLKKGQKLKIFLDDGAPIENVPRSVAGEGHRIVEQVKVGNHWAVLIEKGE